MVYYVSTPTRSPTYLPALDDSERRYLHDFLTKTGPELAGVYNPELWLRYTVKMTYYEPAIKHAVIAITALHRQFRESTTMSLVGADISFALQQYTKAISLLTESIRQPSWTFPDTPLIACMLFCAFESMSYHLHSAISHASSGLKIITERQRCGSRISEKSVPTEILSPIYTRLDTQGLELASFQCQRPLQYRTKKAIAGFDSIDEAQRMFDDLTNSIFHAMYEIDAQDPATTQMQKQAGLYNLAPLFRDLVSNYRSWCDAFDQFIHLSMAEDQIGACLLLQLWRILIEINLQVDLRAGEMHFDCFETSFQAIVELAFEFVLLHGGKKARLQNRDQSLPAAPHDEHLLHQSTSNDTGSRGGYLGIHPRHTPFVTGKILDQTMQESSTRSLLRVSRSSRKDHLEHAKNAGDLDVLPHDLKPSFSFSPGIVSPLYVTISRCRNSAIRRSALLLMQRCKRREDLWDSELAARLGTRVMNIEEQRARDLDDTKSEKSTALHDERYLLSASQIPNEARVRMIKPTFLPGRKSIERFYLGLPGALCDAQEMGETWIEEILEW